MKCRRLYPSVPLGLICNSVTPASLGLMGRQGKTGNHINYLIPVPLTSSPLLLLFLYVLFALNTPGKSQPAPDEGKKGRETISVSLYSLSLSLLSELLESFASPAPYL